MKKVIKWIVVIVIAIIVLALIFGGREEQTSDSAESTVNTTDSMEVEQSESSDAEEGVSESTTDLLKAYEDNEIKDDRVQKEHAQSQWRGNDE